MIALFPDFVFPIRQELRSLSDRHLIQTVSGEFSEVVRFAEMRTLSRCRHVQYMSAEPPSVRRFGGVVESPRAKLARG